MSKRERESLAEELFAEFLRRRADGEGVDFERLCREYPELADTFQRYRRQNEDARLGEAVPEDAPEEADSLIQGPSSVGVSERLLVKGARLGQYQLEREVGRGGMGVVWQARDLVLNQRVAIKFLPAVLASDKIAMLRLRREAKVLLALTHVNIVRVRNIEARHGLTFLVEEFLQGPTLDQVIERRLAGDGTGVSAEEARWVVEQVVPALQYAHDEGVTHRDIKPANVMLDAPLLGDLGRGPERLKLTDFGLAFVARSALSQISQYKPSGTLPYMAPEVLMGQKPTPAADIYSLGVTVYDMVAGEAPFAHGDIATQILHRVPDPLRSGDHDLDAAVAAAMSKNPAHRPSSADEFLAIARGERRAPSRLSSVLRGSRVAVAPMALFVFGAVAWFLLDYLRSDRAASDSTNDSPAEVVAKTTDLEERPTVAQVFLDPPFDEDGSTVYTDAAMGGLELRGRVEQLGSTLVVQIESERRVVDPDLDGYFTLRVPLVPYSEYEIQVLDGDRRLASFTVLHDPEEPELEIQSPSNGARTHAETTTISVRARDHLLASVTVDGSAMLFVEDDLWRLEDVPLRVGLNRISIDARDRAGNLEHLELSVHRDQAPPSLVQHRPLDGVPVPFNQTVEVELAFAERVVSAEADGEALALVGEGLEVRGVVGPFMSFGEQRIPWSATNAAGRRTDGWLVVVVVERVPELLGETLELVDPTPGWNGWARSVRDLRSGITFRLVDPGVFRMGSRPGTARMDEEPWRDVRLSHGFYLAETETTVEAWERFATDSGYSSDAERRDSHTWRRPGIRAGKTPAPSEAVTQISWVDAKRFCAYYGYRLPHEAEWEYTARAGTTAAYWWGADAHGGEDAGNFADESFASRFAKEVFPFDDGAAFAAGVASYRANPWGFWDMLGGVWEWCEDSYDPTAYRVDGDPLDDELSVVTDPRVLLEGPGAPRVLRGGSWRSGTGEATCSRRAFDFPNAAANTRGFRPAFLPGAASAPAASLGIAEKVAEPNRVELELGPRRIVCEVERDPEGNLRFKGRFVHWNGDIDVEFGDFRDGLRHGWWRTRHPNGVMSSKGRYFRGRRNDEWTFQDEAGNELTQGSYQEGQRLGSWGSGDLGRSERAFTYGWHADEHAMGALQNGHRQGRWTFRWPNGRKAKEGNYDEGVRHGPWQFWHPEGTPDPWMLSGTWVEGERTSIGGSPWRSEATMYLPPNIAPLPEELAELIPDVQLGEEAAVASKLYVLSTLSDPKDREQVVEGIADLGRALLPSLLRKLIALDLSDISDVRVGRGIFDVFSRLAGRPLFDWIGATDPVSREANRLSSLRLLSLVHLKWDQPAFWELDLRVGGGDPPDQADIIQSIEYVLPDYEARTTGRFGSLPSLDEAAEKAKQARVDGAIGGGLDWLARHQRGDGAWDADGFGALCAGATCEGTGSPLHDVGVTGLALLAFLGMGNTIAEGPYRDNVIAGLLWLLSQQDPDSGLIGGLTAVTGTKAYPPPSPSFVPRRAECNTCNGLGRIPSAGGGGAICPGCNGDGWGGWLPVPFATSPTPPAPIGPPLSAPAVSGANERQGSVYDHAIATLAITQAARTRSLALDQAAQRAIHVIARARNPYGAWRYDTLPRGENDTSVTGWMLQALASARDVGFAVDPDALQGGLDWIDEVTAVDGRVGYSELHSGSSRSQGNLLWPTDKGEALTAVGLLCRVLMNQDPSETALGGELILFRHADLLSQRPPLWDVAGYGCDMYYWYHGSYALYAMGGDAWKKWNLALREALLENQETEGHALGSWDPVGPWGYAGGRVYSTAISTLALQASFRYPAPLR